MLKMYYIDIIILLSFCNLPMKICIKNKYATKLNQVPHSEDSNLCGDHIPFGRANYLLLTYNVHKN